MLQRTFRAKQYKEPCLVKGNFGRKSDKVCERSKAKAEVEGGQLEPAPNPDGSGIKWAKIQTDAGLIEMPVYRRVKLKSVKVRGVKLRGLSSRMSPPHPKAGGRQEDSDYVHLLDDGAVGRGSIKARAEEILKGSRPTFTTKRGLMEATVV
jgi:hypothetical protein